MTIDNSPGPYFDKIGVKLATTKRNNANKTPGSTSSTHKSNSTHE